VGKDGVETYLVQIVDEPHQIILVEGRYTFLVLPPAEYAIELNFEWFVEEIECFQDEVCGRRHEGYPLGILCCGGEEQRGCGRIMAGSLARSTGRTQRKELHHVCGWLAERVSTRVSSFMQSREEIQMGWLRNAIGLQSEAEDA